VPYIQKQENHYLFHAPIANFEGAGRFVLGLMDEIKVLGPEEFKNFLKTKLEARSFQ
jgi:hypothetical protein